MGDVTVVTSLLAFVYSKSKEGDLHNICFFFYIFCAALVQEYLSHLPLKLKKMGQENKLLLEVSSQKYLPASQQQENAFASLDHSG